MKIKRFSYCGMIATAVMTLLATLGSVLLVAWLTIGPEGLALLEGMALIDAKFVGEYDKRAVRDAALDGMVAGLDDRWSYYLTPTQHENTRERRSNRYVGIGVTVSYDAGAMGRIEQVVPGGPADQAGILAGEIITAIDGNAIAEDARSTVAAAIRGAPGTTLELTLLGADGARRTVTVTRAELQVEPVQATLLADGVGYVQVKNFYDRSADQFIAAVTDLRARGARALVFDMRNNGGGYLGELHAMLDALLPEGPVFRAISRKGEVTVVESDAVCVDLPMAILVNADTYSAAEFFAGELQEWGVGQIVGTETSGKGYSQETFPLSGGGALGLSTAKYATGEGRSFVGTGLTLDREISLSAADEARLSAGTLPHNEDAQLQAALALLPH